MIRILPSHHPFRIFLISGLITIASLIFVGVELGLTATLTAVILIVIEITFSFDNAIINARILAKMNKFWQTFFMTAGVFIAVFGMRLIFPILIVMITAGLSAGDVIDLALNEPMQYSEKLIDSHIAIASFGGMFLLMLALQYFFDDSRDVRWIHKIEQPMQQIGRWWSHIAVSAIVLILVSALPTNYDQIGTLIAGVAGIITYVVIHGLAELFTKQQEKKSPKGLRTGLAGFMSFLYLEVLDASFSFDSVIGAFAITQDVILIAIGLGVGALWVRSLTLFMVRKQVLHTYKYLEHGAHYTIVILAGILLTSIFVEIPEIISGSLGIIVVGLSIVSSIRERNSA